MIVRMTNGECCIACNKLIHTAVRFVTINGNPVHKNCLRCSECNRRLQNTFYKEDEKSRKFYCRKHIMVEEQHGTAKHVKLELETETDLKNENSGVIQRPSSLGHRFQEIHGRANTPDTSVIRNGSRSTVNQILESEFRAQSMHLIQKSPRALNILFNNKEIQDAVLRVAMNNPELEHIIHNVGRHSQEMSNVETRSNEQEPINSSAKEKKVSSRQDDTSEQEVDEQPAQLRLHNIALDSRRQLETETTGPRNRWVLKLDNCERTNSKQLVEAVNVFVHTSFDTDQEVPPKGAVANAVQRLTPVVEKHEIVSSIQRTNSCPQLAKSKLMESCHYCQKRVYLTEKMTIYDKPFHRQCFKCQQCGIRLNLKTFDYDKETQHFLCFTHSKKECDLTKKQVKIKRKSTKDESSPKHKWSTNPNKWKLAQMSKKLSKVFHIKEHHEILEELEEDESLV